MGLKESVSDYLKFDELKENFIKLIEAKFELKKIEIQENIESKLAKMLVFIVIGIFLFIAFLMLNILLAIFLNSYLESNWIGYLVLLIFYLVIIPILLFYKDKIELMLKEKIQKDMDKSKI